MPVTFTLTSWTHPTRAMCKGTLELPESVFLCLMHASYVNLPLSWIGDILEVSAYD